MFSESKTAQSSLTTSVGAPSIISQSLTITGNLKTTGDLQIDGSVIGDVLAARVLIGDAAKVHGEVTAEEVIVRGEVRGALKGGIVEITRSARVHGNIEHESLAIESGAQVDGTMKHTIRAAAVTSLSASAAIEPAHRAGLEATLTKEAKDKAEASSPDPLQRTASALRNLTQRSTGRST